MSTCLCINSACWCLLSADFYTNVIISSSLKPYIWVQTVCWCFQLCYHHWFMIKETDNFKTDHGYSIRSCASCRWPWRVKIYITSEKLSSSKYMTAKHILSFQRFRNIIFNNERIIWGFLRFVFKVIQNVSDFRNSHFRTGLKIRLSKFRGYLKLPGYAVRQRVCSNLILWLGVTINSRFNLGCWLVEQSYRTRKKVPSVQ